MVEGLTPLEQAVLDKLLAGDHPALAVLRTQAEQSHVSHREFTGVGFWTDIDMPDDLAAVTPSDFTVGDVHATVDGLERGAGFVLLVRGGRMVQLEGYAHDEPWPLEIGAFRVAYIKEPRELKIGVMAPTYPRPDPSSDH